MITMKNPHTGKKLSKASRKKVEQFRTIRANARRYARSGNPANRVPAQKVERRAALAIDAIYQHEADQA